MSIPPQLIRVKRKRADEAPVTFFAIRQPGPEAASQRAKLGVPAARCRRARRCHPQRRARHPRLRTGRCLSGSLRQAPKAAGIAALSCPWSTPPSAHASQAAQSGLPEPRRFHVSRSATRNHTLHAGVSKKYRYAAAIFVEGARKHKTPSRQEGVAAAALHATTHSGTEPSTPDHAPASTVGQRQLKRPGVSNRARDAPKDAPVRQPLPASFTNRRSDQDMGKIAAEMNQWVLSEIGATIKSLEEEKEEPAAARFKPKPPAQRYHERHPELAPTTKQAREPADATMLDISEGEDGGDDGDDWIIDEYVRIPATWVNWDVAPSDIGVLELDDDETTFFYGSLEDEEDALDGDDEDENAENHYSADYPEDEVDSDDEYGRNPYNYRDDASDDEEYGYSSYSDEVAGDEAGLDGDDDDARMARMRAYMSRLCVSSQPAPDG